MMDMEAVMAHFKDCLIPRLFNDISNCRGYILLFTIPSATHSQDSAVSIVTDYRLNDRGVGVQVRW
jgi:hypothetical protein